MTGWFMHGSPLKRRFQTVNKIKDKNKTADSGPERVLSRFFFKLEKTLRGVYKAQAN